MNDCEKSFTIHEIDNDGHVYADRHLAAMSGERQYCIRIDNKPEGFVEALLKERGVK